MTLWRWPVALLSAALSASATIQAQGADSARVLWVDVRDAASRQPVVGARVRALNDAAARALTDSAGLAAVTLRAGQRQLVTSRIGFRPDTTTISVAAWVAGVVSVTLLPNAQSIAGMTIEGESPARNPMIQEFERRRERRAGGASFIGPEVFERSPSNKLTDFLRRGIQGVKLVDSAGVLLPVSSRGEIVRANVPQTGRGRAAGRDAMERVHCVLRVVVDGVPKEWGFDLSLLEPREVYGIEVYAGPSTVPAQYQSMGRDGYCGVILIWTRAR